MARLSQFVAGDDGTLRHVAGDYMLAGDYSTLVTRDDDTVVAGGNGTHVKGDRLSCSRG
jgi:hypothetical protein